MSTVNRDVKIIKWVNKEGDEASCCYRLDEPGAGDRFFKDIFENAETDGSELFELYLISPEEWRQIQKDGNARA